MKFSNGSINILAATSFLATATTATLTEKTTPSHRRGLKISKGSTKDKKIKLLAVQKGEGCFITEVELDVYNLVIKEMNQDTIQFQERPGRGASTISTAEFTNDFSGIFPLDDLPNAAISFGQSQQQQDSKNEEQGTLIVQLSNPTAYNNGTGLKYTLKQSQSQAAVGSLQESIVKNIDGFVNNSCSLFIDFYFGNDHLEVIMG